MTKGTLKRTSHYSANRRNYISSDGSYVYWHWDDELKKEVPMHLIPGKDGVTQEWILLLDDSDHAEDLQDRYAEENADYSFQNRKTLQKADGEEYELETDVADLLESKGADPYDVLFQEKEPVNHRVEQLAVFMDKLTPAQRDLVFDHFGALKQFTEIRDEENAADGTDKSVQSVFNRMDKILTRACKEFGVEKTRKKR